MKGYCNNNFILIGYLGEGAFGKVYKVYNKKLNIQTAIKITKIGNDNELKKEIDIISTLSSYNIPNIPTFYDNGYCNLLHNLLYYEMSLEDGKMLNYITENNVTKIILYNIMFELLYTLSCFRLYNFKHRDLSIYNVLFKLNNETRKYNINNYGNVNINNIIQPIISDFNTGIFEYYTVNVEQNYNDIIAMLNIFNTVIENTKDLTTEDYTNIQNLYDYITDNDDLSYEFIHDTLVKFLI